ncbi:hypothetical protein D9611_009098 [Ephemerocybe angulata]|uniref:Uncharacterized protein n=1 Tax=Ephemerocybe angulata TaxID=980116 RepID=A0A8H5CDL5_9AGAR|nr:hypothetical protein D9611_009098 [Tulosesus angulatus]
MSFPQRSSLALPQELVDSVIDALESDSTTLKAVGLVAKQWYRRSRAHLFEQIHLGEKGNPAEQLHQLLELIKEQPALIECIKHFTVSDKRGEWLATSAELLELLPRLSLRCFGIGVPSYNAWVDWETLTPELQIALYDRILDSNLTSLSLHGVRNMDVAILSQCHHLEELIMADVYQGDGSSNETPRVCFPLNQSPAVQGQDAWSGRLEVTACGDALKALMDYAENAEATLAIHNAMELQLSAYGWDDEMTEAISTLLQACASSVSIYSIQEDINPETIPGAVVTPTMLLEFSRFTGLQNLYIWTSYHHFRLPYNTTFNIIIQEFERMCQSSDKVALYTVALDFQAEECDMEDALNLPDIGTRIRTVAADGVWGRIDEVLSREKFDLLEEVCIFFNHDSIAGTPDEEEWEASRNLLLSSMTRLDARGVRLDISRQ